MRNEAAIFFLAVQFLTRLPMASADLYSEERMAASVRYYPLVGIVIGSLCAASFWLAHLVLPQGAGVIIAVAAGLLITGAFHEDGLADTFDGLGGGQTREKALAIMKDSRLGTYGTLALIIALALKVACLFVLSPAFVALALVAGHGLSRLSSVAVLATSQYVRPDGAGKFTAGGISATSLTIAIFSSAVFLFAVSVVMPTTALAYACCGLVIGHVAMRAFFERKLGGYTGDTLGAVQQASEIGFYLGLAAWF